MTKYYRLAELESVLKVGDWLIMQGENTTARQVTWITKSHIAFNNELKISASWATKKKYAYISKEQMESVINQGVPIGISQEQINSVIHRGVKS